MKFSNPKNGSRNVNASVKRISFLGHLGLIAGLFGNLKLTNLLIGSFRRKETITYPIRSVSVAMVINGLGFVGQRLYLFPDFFKNISTERLFGEGVTKEDLNQYAIGETLDRIYEYGPTKLFMDIVLHVMNRLSISCHLLHTDTTSVSVYGDYESEEEGAIDITFGVPKNGRWDLKQLVLSLIVNQQGIPFLHKSTHLGTRHSKTAVHGNHQIP